MSSRIRRSAIAALSTLSLMLLSSVTQAASSPTVLHRSAGWGLPATPAYAQTAVKRDLTTLNSSSRARIVNVVVDSRLRVQALTTYAQAVSNPKSPLYHHFLSPTTLDRRFGPSPAMLEEAKARMAQAGWTIEATKGLVVTARVPSASAHPGLPVSPDIWSMTGFAAHGLIRNPIPAAPAAIRHVPASSIPASAAALTPNFSLAGEQFNQPPAVLQQTTASNGDVVSVMCWNPEARTNVPAGLPINLFVTVEDPQGNFLPIKNIGHLSDSANSLVSYGTGAMPASSNTLWQMPIAAWRDIGAGDSLTLTVTLQSGLSLNASFPLPSFTGPATVLTPLSAQQMNQLSGIGTTPAHPGAIALFSIGTPPSLKDLALYLDQNTTSTTMPSVLFHYEDGATANEFGQAADTQESQLDLEAATGAAPGAPIEEYVYPENDSNDPLISYLTDLSQQSTAKVASLSYGFFGEDPTTLTTLMDALTAEGITLLEASGDQGVWNSGSDPGPVGLSSLEQIPSVLSVGGLDLAAPANTDSAGDTIALTGPAIADAWGGDFLNGIPTTVAQAYTNLNAASSGGYSTTTPIPSWQAPFLPPGSPGFGVPTLSALAGFPGMSGYLQGQNIVFGGTSLAAPLTAGWLDQAEAALDLSSTGMGNINPLLYLAASTDPSLFTQALWGQDGLYSITDTRPGSWNPMTGLGMLNWGGFVNDYTSLVPTATAAATLSAPSRVEVGRPVVLTAYVRGVTSPQLQFSYQAPQNGRWITSGPFSSATSYAFTAKVPGHYVVEVKVKAAGGQILTRRQDISATTSKPMVSSLGVRTWPLGHVASRAGWIKIIGHATDTGPHPEYQFWLNRPGTTPHIIQGWSPRAVLWMKHLNPGRYVVTVDALDRAEVLQHNWAATYRKTLVIAVR